MFLLSIRKIFYQLKMWRDRFLGRKGSLLSKWIYCSNSSAIDFFSI
ncbi:hypothetical protein HJ01_01415 [Flavobacterium frigoris PS1]|uniref:Uncharacterized protein n=1 Tax=Flavobacterium frigoris (strain PS1) TaxID=1086011 RepID=H7FQF5_FLAFP|nr:hypothetical protein HJ01_01415 [Flavobacterium frigoris PS1]